MADAKAIAQVTQIYVGYFNRAPDPAGLQFWVNQYNNGMSVGEIADYFSTAPETLETYPYLREPALNSVNDFINQIYNNLFGQDADAAGLAFWAGKLTSGEVSEGVFIETIAQNAARPSDQADVMDNRIAAGAYFAEQLSANNVTEWNQTTSDAAYAALAEVNNTAASLIEAKGNIDAFAASGGTAWPGSDADPIILSANNHVYVGSAANDTFQGVLGNGATFTPFDKIDGAGGDNTFQIAVTAPATLPLATEISNIQTVQIVSGAAANFVTGLNTAAFGAQVEEIWQIGAATNVTLSANDQVAGFGEIAAALGAAQTVTAGTGVSNAGVALDKVLAASAVTFAGTNNTLTEVTVSGSVASNGALTVNTSAATTQVDTINLGLTSNSAVTLTTEAGVVSTVDASESTGNLTIDTTAAGVSALTALTAFNGGSGNDVLTASNTGLTAAAFNLDAGAGNDTINFTVTRAAGDNVINSSLTGGEGADIFNLTAAAVAGGNLSAASIANNAALQNSALKIADFGNGADQISLVQYAGLNDQVSQAVVNAALAGPVITDLLTAVTAVAGTTAAAGDWALFQYQDNTYLYIDDGAALALDAGDTLVQLTGVDLSDLTVGTGAAGTTIYA